MTKSKENLTKTGLKKIGSKIKVENISMKVVNEEEPKFSAFQAKSRYGGGGGGII